MGEVKAFMLMLAIGNVTYAILMAGYARTGAPDASMKVWTWAKLVEGAAFFAFWLRPDMPSAVGALVSNGLLIAAAVGEAMAYCMFLGYQWKSRLYVVAVLCELLLFVAVVGGTSLPQLAVLMSLIIAGISGASAFIMFGAKPRFDLLRCIIGAPNLMISVAFFWRAYVAFSGGRLTVFSSSPAQTMIYIGAYFLLTVNGFGFLLLCKQKDERSLRELATKDNLTGLVNRHAFLSRAEQAHALAKRLRQPLALLMIDIDHFKQLNDRYGHTSGDTALRAFAQAGQTGLRKNDLFGRLGGEEFAVLLPAADLGQAMDAAERLRLAVSAVSLDADGENHSITVSIGVTEVSNDEMVSAALARADKVLYVAKRNGRNRVEADVSIAAPFSANGAWPSSSPGRA